MMLLIPLVSTPTLSNAAESTPVSVSVEPVGPVGNSTSLARFLVTVEHSNGLTTTSFVSITVPDSSAGNVYTYDISSKTTSTSITPKQGKFVTLSGEPGVVFGDSTNYSYSYDALSDIGYSPSSACVQNGRDVCLTAALKDKPQTGTQVVQMPTTGAPEGLTMAGVSALGVGVAALLAAGVRRRV